MRYFDAKSCVTTQDKYFLEVVSFWNFVTKTSKIHLFFNLFYWNLEYARECAHNFSFTTMYNLNAYVFFKIGHFNEKVKKGNELCMFRVKKEF